MDKLKQSGQRANIFAIVGKKGLRLTEDERRAIQVQVTGKASLSDMSTPELDDVISHLRRLQAAVQGKTAFNPWAFVFRLVPDRQAMAKKVYRLAEKIGQMQTPPTGPMPPEYVEGITRQMTGTDHPLEFCDARDLHKVVQALEIHIGRLKKKAAV